MKITSSLRAACQNPDVNCPLSGSERCSAGARIEVDEHPRIERRSSRDKRTPNRERWKGRKREGERRFQRNFNQVALRVDGWVWVLRAHARSSAVNYTYGFHYRTSLLRNRKLQRLSRPPRCFPEPRGIDILPIARTMGRRRGDASAKVTSRDGENIVFPRGLTTANKKKERETYLNADHTFRWIRSRNYLIGAVQSNVPFIPRKAGVPLGKEGRIGHNGRKRRRRQLPTSFTIL